MRNCYQGIDELPIFYWWKIHEEKNLSYLIKTQSIYIVKKEIPTIQRYALGVLWNKILEEFILRHGFSDQYAEIMRKTKELIKLKIQKIVNEDKSQNAFIKVCQEELNDLQSQMTGGNFWELKVMIERQLGFAIDPMKTSTNEFYTYVKMVEKESKRAKKK